MFDVRNKAGNLRYDSHTRAVSSVLVRNLIDLKPEPPNSNVLPLRAVTLKSSSQKTFKSANTLDD